MRQTCSQEADGPDDAHGHPKGLSKIGSRILQADVQGLLAVEAARKDGHHHDVDQQRTEKRYGRLHPVVRYRLQLARIVPGVDLPAAPAVAT